MPNDSAAAALPHVIIDVEKIRNINTGLGRFSLHLAEEIIRLAPGRFRPILFLPSGAEQLLPVEGYDVVRVGEWRKEGFVRFVRPFARPFLPHGVSQIWHMTHQAAKYFPLDPRTPVLLTIHDLNFLHEGETKKSCGRIRRKLAGVQRRVDRAAAITTVSEFTADEVTKHLQLRGKPVHVVPNGVAPPAAASALRPGFLSEGPFLLTVGNVLPHKNFHVLLGMMEHLPTKRLVVAGKKETPYGAAMEREITKRGLGDRVIMPGEVSDGDRQWLYEHCEAFVFPSLAEGFGFPVLEAIQCGKPVFAARTTSLPEVGGDVACYFDSFDPRTMADVLRAGINRAAVAGFADACRQHAARFSWSAAAAAYVEHYHKLIEATL